MASLTIDENVYYILFTIIVAVLISYVMKEQEMAKKLKQEMANMKSEMKTRTQFEALEACVHKLEWRQRICLRRRLATICCLLAGPARQNFTYLFSTTDT